MQKNRNGFTLIEVLIVVLIIGILASIALPRYQMAVDKTKYTNLMPLTKSILESQLRALLETDNPSFEDLDIAIPGSCSLVDGHPWAITCDDGRWGCLMRKSSGTPIRYWTRCTDVRLNASYFYTANMDSAEISTRCYAHTTEEDDRPNRLCKALTGKANYEAREGIAMFWRPNGPWVQSNGYSF